MDFMINLFAGWNWQLAKDTAIWIGIWVYVVILAQVSAMMVSAWILLLRGENEDLGSITALFAMLWATTYMVLR